MVATTTANEAHAKPGTWVITKAIKHASPPAPSAGCMNSSSGCSPGRVVIRVWVMGGTLAPDA